jgi:hypothetical protein
MLPSPCRTRSTIVQTFDNVTVIIPNSDFISKQVTNWSLEVLIIFRMGPVVIDPDSGRFRNFHGYLPWLRFDMGYTSKVTI